MLTKWDNAFGKNDIRGIYGQDVTEELYFSSFSKSPNSRFNFCWRKRS